MTYADNQYKWVVVLNRRAPLPQLLNAVGHLAVTMQTVCEDTDARRVHQYDGVDGTTYAVLSHWPVIVLKANNGNQLRALRQAATTAKIPCQVFVDTMLGGSAEAQLARTKAALPGSMQFIAVFLFGPSEALNRLTKKFSLLTDVSVDVSGPPTAQETEQVLDSALADGLSATASDATLRGVPLPTESGSRYRELLKGEVLLGVGQAERGDLIPFDEALAERVKSTARAWFATLRGR
jgi:hypothetical protein